MLGEVIKAKRKSKGLSIYSLAGLTGYWHSRIFDIETGKTKDPKFSTVCKIARVLEIDLSELDETE
jgi:transcriptional regulator with XRE-family HTH domain